MLRQSADDVATVIGAGVTVFEALKAYDQLEGRASPIRVIDLVLGRAGRSRRRSSPPARATGGRLITVEDHYAAGGIGDAVAEAVADAGFTVHRLAVREIPRSGKPDELLDRFGISARHIVAAVRGQATHDEAGCGRSPRRALLRPPPFAARPRDRYSALNSIGNVACVCARCCGRSPNEHDAARVHVHRDHGRAAGHQLFALQPSRRDDVACSDSAPRPTSSATRSPRRSEKNGLLL